MAERELTDEQKRYHGDINQTEALRTPTERATAKIEAPVAEPEAKAPVETTAPEKKG